MSVFRSLAVQPSGTRCTMNLEHEPTNRPTTPTLVNRRLNSNGPRWQQTLPSRSPELLYLPSQLPLTNINTSILMNASVAPVRNRPDGGGGFMLLVFACQQCKATRCVSTGALHAPKNRVPPNSSAFRPHVPSLTFDIDLLSM